MPEQEIRFALVMNGGVSLAVWIAGVSHEIDLIRRASTAGTPDAREHDSEVYALWQDLMQPASGLRRQLVVDVLAGTSAGGLNSVMLANAIAHNGTLDPEPSLNDEDPVVPSGVEGPWLREVWCALGGLRQGNLVPKPLQDPGSVLDGDFFLSGLERIMKKLSVTAAEPGAGMDRPHNVTLFTTASGLGKQQYKATDAAGQPFDVSDHRFLYSFTTDELPAYEPSTLAFADPPTRANGFAAPETLAMVARASASFPVAFKPVRELDVLNSIPPRRRPQATSATTSWLVDGGVLDNAPFGPVLDTIAKGPVAGDVRRFIVYVVPSAGIGEDATEVDAAADDAPGWAASVLSAFQFPREVDFRSDVEELGRLRAEGETAWSDSQFLYQCAVDRADVSDSVLAASAFLQPTYTRGRAAGAVWEAITIGEAGGVTLLDQGAAEPMEAADAILNLDLGWTPRSGDPVVTLTGPPERPLWPWGVGPAERVVRTMLRSVRSELKAKAADVAEHSEAGASIDEGHVLALEEQLRCLSTAQRRIFSLRREASRAIAAGYSDLTPSSGEDAEARRQRALEVAHLIGRVFQELRIPEALGRQIAIIRDHLPEGAKLLRTALAVEIVSRCTSARTPDQRSAPFSFVRLGPDADLPVLAAEDQALARDLGSHVLYGAQVGNFGAFGADKWRRWDWLMGRLHAAAHIGMLMHEANSPAQREVATAWIGRVQAAILAAEGSSAAELAQGLKTLQAELQDKGLKHGIGRMLDVMNDADHERASGERSTQHVGDRLVAVATALGPEPGAWIQALASRTDSGKWRQSQRAARWFLAPTRIALWTRLTGERVSAEEQLRGPLAMLRAWPWVTALVVGLAVTLGVIVTYQSQLLGWPLLICLGVALTVAGVAGLVLVGSVRRLRTSANSQLRDRLSSLLPSRNGRLDQVP